MKKNTAKIADSIFDRVLEDIKPSKQELQQYVYNINELTSRLKRVIPGDVEIRVVGSVVRGTQLRGDSDIDLFLLFNKKTTRETMTKRGLEYAKKIVRGKGERYEIKYAEHPYVRVYIEELGVKADIVPAFKIDNIEDMSTAVDRSPMHADFMNTHLTDRQRDEIRVLKYLLKAHKIYGAEVKTSGFSGYLCELMIYHYGSLIAFLEAAAEFRLPILLDPNDKIAINDTGLIKRFGSMFVVIDPIDKNRNVAAGVSMESLSKLAITARNFVERPSIRLFYGKGLDLGHAPALLRKFIADSGLEMFTVVMQVPDKSEDVVWPQLRKVSEFIAGHAERFGFKIYFTIPTIVKDKGIIAFFATDETIKARLLKGPSVFIAKAQREFSEVHKNALVTFLRCDTMYALEKSRYEKLEEFLKDVTVGKFVKRHKDIKISGAKLFVGMLPKEYVKEIYYDLMEKIDL
jgi:tRNA nucleotidyltransferase (CCA-adding enzyme)